VVLNSNQLKGIGGKGVPVFKMFFFRKLYWSKKKEECVYVSVMQLRFKEKCNSIQLHIFSKKTQLFFVKEKKRNLHSFNIKVQLRHFFINNLDLKKSQLIAKTGKRNDVVSGEAVRSGGRKVGEACTP
jgi:hypothetical protein